jgi:hypothetical protein
MEYLETGQNKTLQIGQHKRFKILDKQAVVTNGKLRNITLF